MLICHGTITELAPDGGFESVEIVEIDSIVGQRRRPRDWVAFVELSELRICITRPGAEICEGIVDFLRFVFVIARI